MAARSPDVPSGPRPGDRILGRLIGDSALYGLSAVIAKILALLTVPYLTRALSPTGYGIADLATSTAAVLTLVAMFSGDIPAAREHGRTTDERARRGILTSYVWAVTAVGSGVALVLMPFASLIAARFWGSNDLAMLTVLSLVLVPVSATQAALAQIQRIRSRPVAFAILSLVDLLAQLGLAVILVAAGLGAAGVVIGFILGSLVGLIIAAIAARDSLPGRPDWRVMRGLTARGIQFLPHVAMFVSADWAVRSVLANTLGTDAVAQLGVAIRVASVLGLVGAAFAMAWGPVALARTSGSATAHLFGRVLSAYGAISVALALMLAAIGPELLPIVAGEGYQDAALILPGFALAYAIAGAEYVVVVAAGVSDRASRIPVATTAGALVQVGSAIVLIPAAGIAVVGPIAVLGRMVSFTILLAGLRSSITVPKERLVVGGGLALVAFIGVQAAIGQDALWVAGARWILALVLTAWGLFLLHRSLRSPELQAGHT